MNREKEVKYELTTSNLDTMAKIRHVAVAVVSIEASLPIWKVFGIDWVFCYSDSIHQ